MGSMYGESGGMPLCQKFHYKSILHDRKDQVFVVGVVVIDLTWEMVALNVISRPTSAIVKLSTNNKIHKY
jgi:hypothetical protein